MAIEKALLGVAGEMAVAAELCRRNIYAQLTLGNQKRVDLLAYSEDSKRLVKIEVKTKQIPAWANCKGIARDDTFIVFVDFEGKSPSERPGFYTLSNAERLTHVENELDKYRNKHPDKRAEIDDMNCLVLQDELTQGKPYKGCGVRPTDIASHVDTWGKISTFLQR